jgi:hypothetical protein
MTGTTRAPEVELVIARDPLLLLERAAEAFLTPLQASAGAPFPSPPYLLALRRRPATA